MLAARIRALSTAVTASDHRAADSDSTRQASHSGKDFREGGDSDSKPSRSGRSLRASLLAKPGAFAFRSVRSPSSRTYRDPASDKGSPQKVESLWPDAGTRSEEGRRRSGRDGTRLGGAGSTVERVRVEEGGCGRPSGRCGAEGGCGRPALVEGAMWRPARASHRLQRERRSVMRLCALRARLQSTRIE